MDIEVGPDGAVYWVAGRSAYCATYGAHLRSVNPGEGNTIDVQGVGPAGHPYVLEASSDLLDWEPIATNTFTTSAIEFHVVPTGGGARFYRLKEDESP